MKLQLNFMTPPFARLLAVCVLAVVGSGTAVADCTIGFQTLPSGTEITNQYRGCGVVFRGVGADPPPLIFDYGANDIGRILHSYDWYAPILVRFVEPSDPQVYDPVSYIEFDVTTGGQDLVEVRVFDVNGGLITTWTSQLGSPETVAINLGVPIAAYMIVDDIQDTSYVIDNLRVRSVPPVFRDGFLSGDTRAWSDAVY